MWIWLSVPTCLRGFSPIWGFLPTSKTEHFFSFPMHPVIGADCAIQNEYINKQINKQIKKYTNKFEVHSPTDLSISPLHGLFRKKISFLTPGGGEVNIHVASPLSSTCEHSLCILHEPYLIKLYVPEHFPNVIS